MTHLECSSQVKLQYASKLAQCLIAKKLNTVIKKVNLLIKYWLMNLNSIQQ